MQEVPDFVQSIIEEVIAKYRPTMFALVHGDMGHQIEWDMAQTAYCIDCGTSQAVETSKKDDRLS
jgi:hypothetical protein